MRFLVYMLLLANVLLALWFALRPAYEDNALLAGLSGPSQQLVLLGEYQGRGQAPDTDPVARSDDKEVSDTLQPSMDCARIGGFRDLPDLTRVLDDFNSEAWYYVGGSDVSLPPLHRVFLPSAGERVDAQVLHAEVTKTIESLGVKIDTYLVIGGEFDNVVSLGVFSESANALNVQRILSANGFDPQIAIESRLRREHWLDVEWDEDSDFAKKTRELALTSGLTLTVSENLCEMIAQPE